MRTTTETRVTVDGVSQKNGGARHEDRRGGWALARTIHVQRPTGRPQYAPAVAG